MYIHHYPVLCILIHDLSKLYIFTIVLSFVIFKDRRINRTYHQCSTRYMLAQTLSKSVLAANIYQLYAGTCHIMLSKLVLSAMYITNAQPYVSPIRFQSSSYQLYLFIIVPSLCMLVHMLSKFVFLVVFSHNCVWSLVCRLK